MAQVWSREAWNALIRRVNDLCQHPDSGCEVIEPLNEVAERHIWTPDDIIAVRDKLEEICPENVFEAETVKWKQDIIDEIENAIEAGWCNCCDWEGPYSINFPVSRKEYDYKYYYSTQWSWPVCHGSIECWWYWKYIPLYITPLGPPGFRNRRFAMDITGTSTYHVEGYSYWCEPDIHEVTPLNFYTIYGYLDDDGYVQGRGSRENYYIEMEHHFIATSTSGECCSGVSYREYSLKVNITVGSYQELQELGYSPTGTDLPIICL